MLSARRLRSSRFGMGGSAPPMPLREREEAWDVRGTRDDGVRRVTQRTAPHITVLPTEFFR